MINFSKLQFNLLHFIDRSSGNEEGQLRTVKCACFYSLSRGFSHGKTEILKANANASFKNPCIAKVDFRLSHLLFDEIVLWSMDSILSSNDVIMNVDLSIAPLSSEVPQGFDILSQESLLDEWIESAVISDEQVSSTLPNAGLTFQESSIKPQSSCPDHTWCKISPQSFQLRVGPNYDRNKKKAPSSSALYEPFAVDIFT